MKHMNLLPKPKQQELHYEQLLHSVIVAIVISTVIMSLGIIAQLGVWTYFDRSQVTTMRSIKELTQAINKTENAELKKEIQLVNSQIKDFANLSTATPKWTVVLEAIAAQVPPDVTIARITADEKTGKIDIAGYSPTREQVIALYNNINSDQKHFKDIDYPLENVSKPTEVQFKYSFFIQDGILVEAIK